MICFPQSPQQQQALGEELVRSSGGGDGGLHRGSGSGGPPDEPAQGRLPAFWAPAEKAAFSDVFKVVFSHSIPLTQSQEVVSSACA